MERQAGPGRETSFANGALLTPSMPEPWNAPGCLKLLLASLVRSDAPLQLRVRALPGLLLWGVQFVVNSSPPRYQANSVSNFRLAFFSLKMMQSLRQRTTLEYGATMRGTLKCFRRPADLSQAWVAAESLAAEGLRCRKLSRQETIDLEPALAPIRDELAGAIHFGADETGDAHRFCVALAEHVRTLGVQFSFGTAVSGFESGSGRLTSALTDKGPFVADHYVVAAGSYSTLLLRPLGIRLPVRPAKGYSVTFDSPHAASALKIPLVDDEMHAAVVPVGDTIRVAGTAEFAGYDLTLRPERVRKLVSLAQSILPRAGLDPATARPWCGLRPMSADGVPIICCTSLANLWVNTGHGHLGWTMAMGSGALLADLLCASPPAVDPVPYDLKRFHALS